MKQQTQRQLQVAEKIKRRLAEIWENFEVFLPRISITEVQISPDLKNATIFYMVNKEIDKDLLQRKLNETVKKIRYELAKNLTLRVIPKLKFIEDHVEKNAERLEQLLKSSGDV